MTDSTTRDVILDTIVSQAEWLQHEISTVRDEAACYSWPRRSARMIAVLAVAKEIHRMTRDLVTREQDEHSAHQRATALNAVYKKTSAED